MKLNYNYLKQHEGLIPLVLLGISSTFAVLILVKTTSFFTASARAETLVKRAALQAKPNTEAIKECEGKFRAIADNLKKSNLFSPTEPERNPVTSVLGILGDEVLIEDKWYKAGDKIGEARIIAVEASQVRIAWHGQEKVFAPIDSTNEAASEESRNIRRDSKAVAQSNKFSNGSAEMVLIGQAGTATSAVKSAKKQIAPVDKKSDKQRLVAEKKELQKLFINDKKKTQIDRNKIPSEKKKTQSNDKKTREKTVEKITGNKK